MRLLWSTDIHLNFIYKPHLFGEALAEEGDAVVITGDISEAPTLASDLSELEKGFKKPIYFVLGNHDYYKGSFDSVHKTVRNLKNPNLTWLRNNLIELNPSTALVGHEGWYDAQYGNPYDSNVTLYDWRIIKDLQNASFMRDTLLSKLQELGQKAATEAQIKLEEALQKYEKVIFATHVPPFDKACWHRGSLSDPDWMPWFTCKAMGYTLGQLANKYPSKELLVLCGHTHSPGEYQHAPNLKVLTGKSDYGNPQIAKIFEV